MIQPTVKTSCTESPKSSHNFLQPSPPIAPESLKNHVADLESDNDTIIMGIGDDEAAHEEHEHEVIVE